MKLRRLFTERELADMASADLRTLERDYDGIEDIVHDLQEAIRQLLDERSAAQLIGGRDE